MSMLDNGTWVEYLNPVLEALRNLNVDINPVEEEKIKKISEDSVKFLKVHFPNMEHSKVKIAGVLAYFFNERRPLAGKPNNLSNLSRKEYCDILNAIVAQRLAMMICEKHYFEKTDKRMHINTATRREWQRLLRLKDDPKINPKLGHYAMILMLCKCLDGNFPGNHHPW